MPNTKQSSVKMTRLPHRILAMIIRNECRVVVQDLITRETTEMDAFNLVRVSYTLVPTDDVDALIRQTVAAKLLSFVK